MGGPSGGQGGGRTDAGPNRTTATKIGVGNINEKGKKTRSYKSDNPDAFRNRGAEKIKKGVKTPSLMVNAAAAKAEMLEAERKRKGRRSTILTGSGLNEIEDANVDKKTLLG